MVFAAVLFDYSGVLTGPLQLPEGETPYDKDRFFVEMAKSLMSSDPHPWHQLERGEISLDTYLEHAEREVPGSSVMFALDSPHSVMANLELRGDRIELAREVKASGVRVGVLTNNVAEWRPLWLPRLPAGVFDVVIDSSQVACRKPEAAIYELAMRQIGVDDPSEVLFIDDFEWNVTGAEAVGMTGIHCRGDVDLASLVWAALADG